MRAVCELNNEIVYESDDGLRRAVVCRLLAGLIVLCEDNLNSKSEYMECRYGESGSLTSKMAEEIATRFVAGRKIPKRLEWR